MASFRFLYIESDDPQAGMAALRTFIDAGLPSLPEPADEPNEEDRGEEGELPDDDEEGAEYLPAPRTGRPRTNK